MNRRLAILLAILVVFTVYTVRVVAAEGYTGFIPLALSDAWGGQIFADLVIALSLFLTWMWRDARERGLRAWPYLLLTLTTGSIGALGYLVHREIRGPAGTA